MCGIAGIYQPSNKNKNSNDPAIQNMVQLLSHRGPDEYGFHLESGIQLGMARLSIIDLSGGKQPIYNEDKSICVIYNGEIFNYIELKTMLEGRGHRFYTKSDTEIIVHAYEEFGYDFFEHLIGQFAIALWDSKKKELLLARDRVGIRPLFYAQGPDGTLFFASEIKSILTAMQTVPEIDLIGLNQIFTLWVTVPPRTIFKGIQELPAGHYMTVSKQGRKIVKYWSLKFPRMNEYEDKPLGFYRQKLEELLYDAVALRLRADVPVASYLSGGIDSSVISALVKKYHNNDLITFSVAFHDPNFDERIYQQQMIDHLKTDHRMIEATYNNIGNYFPQVVWFAEKPMLRTAPAPLYLLSSLVRSNNIKVVLTGEGSDEIFGGYDIFKEDKIRRFWARFPESKFRPALLTKLYPYIPRDAVTQNFWQSFFKKNIMDVTNKYYSHEIRWNNTAQIKKFLHKEIQNQFNTQQHIYDELDRYLDPDFTGWHPFCRAQYLEMQLFLSGYLLSTQGDRMMMGNSVEGRFPFLDHRVVEFASTIPPAFKMNVLNEKYILKETYKKLLPDSITKRVKHPYRAPISQCFNAQNGRMTAQMLEAEQIKKYGYFDPAMVERLIKKIDKAGGEVIAERDDMAVVGIASMQLLHYWFIENKRHLQVPAHTNPTSLSESN